MAQTQTFNKMKDYMATISGSIVDLFSLAKTREWLLHQNDQRALEAFERFARKVFFTPPGDVDYVCDELSGGTHLRDAVAAARRMLGRPESGIRCGDLLAHITGCSILIIEKKENRKASLKTSRKGLSQISSLYSIYSELYERGMVKSWLGNNALSIEDSTDEFIEEEFSRFGGIAVVHIERLDPLTRDSLLNGFRVERRPKSRNSYVMFERRPYIIVVEHLKRVIDKQIRLTPD